MRILGAYLLGMLTMAVIVRQAGRPERPAAIERREAREETRTKRDPAPTRIVLLPTVALPLSCRTDDTVGRAFETARIDPFLRLLVAASLGQEVLGTRMTARSVYEIHWSVDIPGARPVRYRRDFRLHCEEGAPDRLARPQETPRDL